ncbi:alpha/beta hydrolase-fold protein [Sphingomonas sp. BK481]|uniref:alpha/beta hydrolase-fold protein n=1 Tax=Sphingomonas sp. BK481 TaxID=2586981 RepID=UPI00160B85E6|nr:alpha/beta hydrolase-fold protein [Sphingomonas sp. BK481]MBB3587635.1 ketosteroid isomerase-like protein/S-formylglutathione hydrolase FrmB [Sphingomonas sp. BK481]
MTGLRKLYAVACCLLALFVAPAMAQPQGRLVVSTLQSTSFAGSKIGISPVRNLTVYLPPRYAEAGKRFPVLYFLNYFFEDHREPFASHGAKALLDKAIGQGLIGDVIVVTADFTTPVGSSWYVNSPATGNWEDFMVRELVPHIDATYRTLATRDSRGIAGDGPGAYGAIRFGMRHPEIFGAVYGMQPVASGPNIQPTHSRPNLERMARATSLDDLRDDGFSLIFTSIYQAFAPNPNRPPLFFDPPARRVDGRIVVDSDRTARFKQGFALTALLPAYADNLKSLRGFKFDWGRQDTLVDHVYGAQAFSNLLAEYGVPHEAEEHGGGFRDRHWGEQGRFYTDMLPFFARHLMFGPPATPTERVNAAHAKLRQAMLANDADARAMLYRADARSMPEYQPVLIGTRQIAAYHRAMRERRQVISYVPVTSEVFDLGNTLVEIGTFTIRWSDRTDEERGKYAHVWGVERDGSLSLKADTWGYFRPLADPAGFFTAIPEPSSSPIPLAAGDRSVGEFLRAHNDRDAEAVRTKDVEAKLVDYTDDAIFMPFGDTPKRGMAEIRPYLTAYTAAGSGATFRDVRVWTLAFENHGAWVIEYPKFRVEWTAGGQSGTVKGGGIRLWQRQAGGSLKLHRQIGTHDYVVPAR